MKRLTVTLTFSYNPDAQDIEDAGGWEEFLTQEAVWWREKYNLQLDAYTPIDAESNPFEFQLERVHIEEGEATK